MAQFDVYRNPSRSTRSEIPYLLEVQNDLLETLATRVVVPLVSSEAFGRPVQHLNPVFKVERRSVVMSTAELAGVPRKALGVKVASLAAKRDEIVTAIDFLVTGI